MGHCFDKRLLTRNLLDIDTAMIDSVKTELDDDVRPPTPPHISPSYHFSHQVSRISYSPTRYIRVLKGLHNESISLIDELVPPISQTLALQDSTVLNTVWTAHEKEKFFTALARCGKGNVAEVARRIGTKSLVEVTAYIGLLDEETEWRKQSSTKHRVFDMTRVPAAREVNDKWLAYEDKMTSTILRRSERENNNHATPEEEDAEMLFNTETANELSEW